ncbi:hypothetical protein, partial [Burkholderia multivorans]
MTLTELKYIVAVAR